MHLSEVHLLLGGRQLCLQAGGALCMRLHGSGRPPTRLLQLPLLRGGAGQRAAAGVHRLLVARQLLLGLRALEKTSSADFVSTLPTHMSRAAQRL